MKKVYIKLSFFIILLMFSCHESTENSVNESSVSLDAAVGQQIPLETAKRWMDLYKSKNDNARIDDPTYSLNATLLKQLEQAVKNPTGVTFHHATDDTGVHHILVTAVSNKAKLWGSSVVIDANTNTLIETGKASAWAKRFKDANTDKIWYHFFGINIIKEIMANNNFNYLDIEPALNDGLAPQLKLSLTGLLILGKPNYVYSYFYYSIKPNN